MIILKKIQFLKNAVRYANYYWNLLHDSKFLNERYLGEILRNTHSLEKGLSLENIRNGFGLAKVQETYSIILHYKNNGGDMSVEPLTMFIAALKAYLTYHKSVNFSNESTNKIAKIYKELSSFVLIQNESYGGTLKINRTNFNKAEQDIIARLFNSRHSMREFCNLPVDEDKLKTAIKLAMRCPSACNRQCYRLHIVNKESFPLLDNWFDGIGGFANELDKMLFVTGKISVYRTEELHQWIVTGSIFASYLTLSLEVNNIGCCFVQRPVLPDSTWNKIAKTIGASEDEQLICCLGIGTLKGEYTVPVSHRLDYDKIVSQI